MIDLYNDLALVIVQGVLKTASIHPLSEANFVHSTEFTFDASLCIDTRRLTCLLY